MKRRLAFWVRIIGHALAESPDATGIDELIESFPILLEKDLPYRHWSKEVLDSLEPRKHWIPADLKPLPA